MSHLAWIYIAVFFGSGLVIIPFLKVNTGPALLCAFAFASLGSLFGFLFGVPRSENRKVNTNLEDISNWLTKVLVGIGLSQIVQVPNSLNLLSSYLATGLGGPPETAKVIATGIVLYFPVVGFLGGCLVTKLALQGAFLRADRLDEAALSEHGSGDSDDRRV